MIIEARVEELLEYVDKELQKIKRSRKLPGGIVMTGGTAKLPGMAEFAREKLAAASPHRQAAEHRRPGRHRRRPELHHRRRPDAARHAAVASLAARQRPQQPTAPKRLVGDLLEPSSNASLAEHKIRMH